MQSLLQSDKAISTFLQTFIAMFAKTLITFDLHFVSFRLKIYYCPGSQA